MWQCTVCAAAGSTFSHNCRKILAPRDTMATASTAVAASITAAALATVLAVLRARKAAVPAGDEPTSPRTTVFLDANMPHDAEGRTFHLNVRAGDGEHKEAAAHER